MSTKPKGIAARAGRWSAQHRKIAIFGWLAFVDRRVHDRQQPRHEEGRADPPRRVRPRAEDPGGQLPHAKKTASEETILIQSKTLKASDPQYKAVVKDVERQIGAEAHVRKVQSPYAKGYKDYLVSPDRAQHEGHVRDPRQADRDQGAGQARPGRHEEPPEGPPRVQHLPVRRCQHRRRARRRVREGHAEGRDAVAADHARHPAARLRRARGRRPAAAARPHRRRRLDGSRRDGQPADAGERLHRQRRPARRSCRRRGLLAVLHPARA